MTGPILTGLLLALQFANGSGPAFIAANAVFFGVCLGLQIARWGRR